MDSMKIWCTIVSGNNTQQWKQKRQTGCIVRDSHAGSLAFLASFSLVLCVFSLLFRVRESGRSDYSDDDLQHGESSRVAVVARALASLAAREMLFALSLAVSERVEPAIWGRRVRARRPLRRHAQHPLRHAALLGWHAHHALHRRRHFLLDLLVRQDFVPEALQNPAEIRSFVGDVYNNAHGQERGAVALRALCS